MINYPVRQDQTNPWIVVDRHGRRIAVCGCEDVRRDGVSFAAELVAAMNRAWKARAKRFFVYDPDACAVVFFRDEKEAAEAAMRIVDDLNRGADACWPEDACWGEVRGRAVEVAPDKFELRPLEDTDGR